MSQLPKGFSLVEEEPAGLPQGFSVVEDAPALPELTTEQSREVRRSWQNVTKKRMDPEAERKRLSGLGIDPAYLDQEIKAQDILPKGSSTERARKDARKAGAFARGAVQSATFEFADEGIAAARSLAEGRPYSEVYDEEQKSLAELQKMPGYTGGSVIGAIAGPGAATAAGMRGLYGAVRGTAPRIAGAAVGGTAVGAVNEVGRQKEKDVGKAVTSVPALVEGAMTASAPVATAVATAARPYVQSAISGFRQISRLPDRLQRHANRLAAQPANQIPVTRPEYTGGRRAQEVAARKLERELRGTGLETQRLAERQSRSNAVGNMRGGEDAPFLTVAPESTVNRYVKNTALSPRSDGSEVARVVEDLVEPYNRPLGERVATHFKREAGVNALPEDVIQASRNRIRSLYDDIQTVREQAGGTFVPGLSRSFKASGPKAEKLYNDAAKTMTIDGPGKIDFDSPSFPTFGREYQRRLREYNAAKRAYVQQQAAQGVRPRRAAQIFDMENKAARPVLLNDKNIPTTVMMELYNDATLGASKSDAVSMRILDVFKNNLPRAARGSWLGRFRDNIENLRIIKSSQLDEGMEAVGAGGTAAGPKTRVEFREMDTGQRENFRRGMVLEQGERLRNQIDLAPSTGTKGVVRTPSERDTYNEVVLGPARDRGMSANELNRQVTEVGRRQDIAQRIANARRNTILDEGGVGPAAEIVRKAAYSTGYAASGLLDQISKLLPEGTRQAENYLLRQNIGGVYDAINRVRQADEAVRLAREAASIRNRAIANALISTYVKAPEE